jgi:hypothetical protein
VKKETPKQKAREAPLGTVQHESSADNAQEIGLDKSLNTRSKTRNEVSQRRKQAGSDGGNQEPANNH